MLKVGTKAPAFSLPDQNGDIYPQFLEKGTVIQAYDVWKEKKNYRKISMGVVRTMYLIDEDGVIIKAMDKVKAAENPQQILETL